MENIFNIVISNKKFTQKNKKFNKLNCNPKNISSKKLIKTDSCLDTKTINLLKKLWNKRHPDMKITSRNKKVIWNKLKNFMGSSCENEKCWIDETLGHA